MTVIIALVDSGVFIGKPVRILDVIDQDGTAASAQFLAAIRQANSDLTLCPMDNTEKDICGLGNATILTESQAQGRVAKSKSLALLEISSGYETSLTAQQPVTLTFHSLGNFSSSQVPQQAVQPARRGGRQRGRARRRRRRPRGSLRRRPACGPLHGARREGLRVHRRRARAGPLPVPRRRRDGFTHESYLKRYREVHSRFGFATPGIRGYVQFHVVPDATRAAARAAGFAGWEVDSVSELHMDSLEHFLEEIAGSTIGADATADEEVFVDRPNSLAFCSEVLWHAAEER